MANVRIYWNVLYVQKLILTILREFFDQICPNSLFSKDVKKDQYHQNLAAIIKFSGQEFEQKPTETLDHWKLLSICGFFKHKLYSQTSVIERFCSRPNRFSTKKLRLRLRT